MPLSDLMPKPQTPEQIEAASRARAKEKRNEIALKIYTALLTRDNSRLYENLMEEAFRQADSFMEKAKRP